MDTSLPQLTMPSLPSIPGIPNLNLTYVLNKPVLLLILAVFTVFYCIGGVILFYHWIRYGMRHVGIMIAEALFIFVSLVFFSFALYALAML